MERKLFTLMAILFLFFGSTYAVSQTLPRKTMTTETWRLTLENPGDQTLKVIQAVRDALGLGLKEAKDLVDSAPCILMDNVYYSDAKSLYDTLVGLGATVTLVDNDNETPGQAWLVSLENVGANSPQIVSILQNKLGISSTEAQAILQDLPCIVLETS